MSVSVIVVRYSFLPASVPVGTNIFVRPVASSSRIIGYFGPVHIQAVTLYHCPFRPVGVINPVYIYVLSCTTFKLISTRSINISPVIVYICVVDDRSIIDNGSII